MSCINRQRIYQINRWNNRQVVCVETHTAFDFASQYVIPKDWKNLILDIASPLSND